MIRWRTNIEYEAGQYPWVALLDVFFILLVFFLISKSVVFWPGTKLETALSLPTASSAKLQEADKLIVTITRSGQIFFNEKELDWHGLEQELDGRVLESVQAFSNRHHLEDDPDAPTRKPAIVLRADKDITYETITKIITLARSKNLGIFLVTDIEKKQGVPEVNLLEEP